MPGIRIHPQLAGFDGLVSNLPGVGAERLVALRRLGLETVADLLLHRPRRYEDRRRIRPIRELHEHEPATVAGQVTAMGIKRYGQGSKSVFELVVDDGTARLHCRWWNLPYMRHYFTQGDRVLVHGKPHSLRPRTIDHPETEVIDAGEDGAIHLNRIVPIYPLTEGLPQRWLRALVFRVLEGLPSTLPEPWPDLCAQGALPAAVALRQLHFPGEMAEAEKARQRLALDEFVDLQLAIQERRRKLRARAAAHRCGGDNRLIRVFLARLGFGLTGAQTRVLREIRRDMAGGEPMRRLLQGDVGSGKTAVAACAALMAIESGRNVLVMAPTEILAEQHWHNFRRWFDPLGVGVGLQTGSRKEPASGPVSAVESGGAVETAGSLAALPTAVENRTAAADGESVPGPVPGSVVIGTHALIEEPFALEDVGLVIIDEQHKFGVTQRERLLRKGSFPHLLVMTATPIPRTLGLTLYGDLDISVIDELPAGRAAVRTFVRTSEKLPKVWDFVRARLAEGRQAYVVYPRVEDGGAKGLKAVRTEWERLRTELAPCRVGLLHGRLKAVEKEAAMADFRAGRTQVLLATPLIEVGVDVPNATVMLVENADQFGLAQLHQLRGRIGRGGHESYCILVADAPTAEARERLRVLEETCDGFRIAEADLKLRGPGELLGQAQSGLPPLRFGDLMEDLALVEMARGVAAGILDAREARVPALKSDPGGR